jgi:hypothetical protein
MNIHEENQKRRERIKKNNEERERLRKGTPAHVVKVDEYEIDVPAREPIDFYLPNIGDYLTREERIAYYDGLEVGGQYVWEYFENNLTAFEEIRHLIEPLESENNDLKKAFDKLHDMWNEERFKKAEFENQIMRNRSNDISDTDKKDFIEIAKQAKKTKEGKLIMSDLSKKAMKKLPQGINGRRLDDKYCRILVDKWNGDIR